MSLLTKVHFLFWPLLAAAPFLAQAQEPIKDAAESFKNLNESQLVSILLSFAQWFLALVGVIAVVMVLWASFNYITALGETEKLTRAKKTLIYALVGTLVAILAFSIVTFTKSFLG